MKTKTILGFLVLLLTVTPLFGQVINDELTLFPTTSVRIEKNTDTDQHSPSTHNHIGTFLHTTPTDSFEVVFRSFFIFDLWELTHFNNLSINEVRVIYNTAGGSHTFKLTGPSSISNVDDDEANWNAIGNAESKESGLIYGSNNIASSGIKTYLESQISSEEMIIGALSEAEDSVGTYSNLSLELQVKFSYDAYSITVRNYFDGLDGLDGGYVGVGLNEPPVSRSSPYVLQGVMNGDQINLEAYDNQQIDGHTWVFNDTEGPENKSRWIIVDNEGNPSVISSSQSTSHTANNHQNATIYNEQKRVLNITRNDYIPELGSTINTDNVQLVEGNTFSAPSSQTVNGITYVFYEWSDGLKQNPRTVYASTSTLTAHYKGSQITDTFADNATPHQQKIVRTGNGWKHRVYESMGHVWYEAKPPGGDWEFIQAFSGLSVSEFSGRSPSIAVNPSVNLPSEHAITITWQQDDEIRARVYEPYEGTYTTFHSISFFTGMSPSYAVKPNIAWSGANEMAILWQSTSGLKMNFYEYTGNYPSDYDLTYKASGTIPGTDGSSRNAAISTDKFDFNPYYEVAWEQMESMGQSSIKYTFIYLDSADELESVFSPPLTVSSPHISYNSNVSIVSFPDAARIAWVCSDNGGWEPMQSQACLRSTTVSGGFTPISIFAQSVSSASVAKEADDQYYFAWSEIYTGQEAQYNDDANRYVKSTNLAYARTLNTDAGAIQLHDAPSGSDMRLSAFYNPSGVNYFTESGPLESPQKIAGPLAHDETMSRVISIVDTTSGTALYLDIGAIMLDGKPVGFTEMNDEPLKVEDRIEWMRHQESFPKPGLEMINPYR